jgi:mannan endo-1,4-beta-mannosidase
VYNTAGDFKNEQQYMERYPGDGYADVLSFDAYYSNSKERFTQQLAANLDIVKKVTDEHKKPMCLAETGYQGIPQADWWTGVLLPAVERYPILYVLVWRNGRPDHYYAPYEGQVSATDFKKFHDSPRVIFQQKLSGYHIYR